MPYPPMVVEGCADCGWPLPECDCEEVDETECGEPCNPKSACDTCAEYWQRMIQKGYWNPEGKWTDKGWREVTK